MALTTPHPLVPIERRLRRSLIGASIGLVLAVELMSVLDVGPLASAVAIGLAMVIGALPRSISLLPVVSILVGGLVGLKTVSFVASLADHGSGWLALVGFLAGAAVVLETQPHLRSSLDES